VAGDVDLLGVDHDDVIAGVDVRGVDGLVLAAEATRDLGAQAAEGLAGGIDHVPVALAGLVLGGEGLHRGALRGDWSGWLRGPSPCGTSPRVFTFGERKRRNCSGQGRVLQLAGLASRCAGGAYRCAADMKTTTWSVRGAPV